MEIRKRIAEYAFLAMFAVLPFLDILSPIVLICTIVAGIAANGPSHFKHALKHVLPLQLLLLYFLLAVLSYTWSTQPDETVEKIGKIIVFLLMPIAFLAVHPQNELLARAKKVFLYAMFGFSVFSLAKLAYHYIVDFEISHWYNFVQASMYHKYIPEDAMFLNTALVIVLFEKCNKYFRTFCAIVFLVVIVLFGVRLGLFIYGVIMGIYFLKNWKQLLSVKSLAIAGGTIAICFFLIENSRYVNDKFYDTLDKVGLDTADKVSETGEEYHNITLREKMWSASAELIKQNPIAGVGAGSERAELVSIYERRGYDIPDYNAHNQYLSVTVQLGILGLALLLGIFGVLTYRGIQERNLVSLLVLFVMVVSMITESFLEIQQGLFYYTLFICLLAYHFYRAKGKPNHTQV